MLHPKMLPVHPVPLTRDVLVVRGDPLAPEPELWRERLLQVVPVAQLAVHLATEELRDAVLPEAVLLEAGVKEELGEDEQEVAECLGVGLGGVMSKLMVATKQLWVSSPSFSRPC